MINKPSHSFSFVITFWFAWSFSYSTKSSNKLGHASVSSYELKSSPTASEKFKNIFHVSLGMPRIVWCVSKKLNQRSNIGGSRTVNTKRHNNIAMSVGRIRWPDAESKPNLNVKRYKLLYCSGFCSTSFTNSGRRCCIVLIESARIDFKPLINSLRVKRHICSAFNFQANTSTLNSSGET